ncbi:MAG: HAD-IC family P-type ATPase, partial [Pseudomonadota bacterium]
QGLSPIGSVHGAGSRALIERLCLAGVLANEAHLDYRDDRWVAEGDTVDAAFLILARKLGGDENAWRKTHHETDRVPYESERAWAASRNSLPGGGEEVFLKGSLETILPKCALMATPSGPHAIDPQRLEGQALALARRGYRTLALAAGPADSASGIADEPRGLTFLGLVGMIDPLRPEAAEAVARCREARIEVAMITGDHPETARTIALQLGLIRDDEPVVTGAEIGAADRTEALDPLVKQTRVFARIAPEQKRQIVESLIRSGEYVAVTGDGVNDAPALRHANVGIAMGDRGTDLARETADLILTDDNFASIVSGVEEGRIVYNNIRKVVALLVSTGASAILLFFLSVLAGLPMPLTAVQLLWLNLVANGVQDVALAFERAEGHELARPPRATTEPIFDSQMIAHVVLNGIWMGAIAFAVSFYHNTSGMDEDSTRNIVLMLMILFGNVHALNTRSEQRSLFKTSLTSNRLLLASIIFAQSAHLMAMHLPGLSHVLAIEPVRIGTWLELLVLAASLILLDEGLKAWHRRQIAAH